TGQGLADIDRAYNPYRQCAPDKVTPQKPTEIGNSNQNSGQFLHTPEKASAGGQSKHSNDATPTVALTTENDADEVQSLEEGEAVDDDDEDSGETENSDEGTDCAETASNDVAQRLDGNPGQRHGDPVKYDSPPSRRVNIEGPLRDFFPSSTPGLSDLQ
ncbi:unnamed protein product, partial [Dibothriocephalus latus]